MFTSYNYQMYAKTVQIFCAYFGSWLSAKKALSDSGSKNESLVPFRPQMSMKPFSNSLLSSLKPVGRV